MKKRSLMMLVLVVSALVFSACQSSVKGDAPKAAKETEPRILTAEEAQSIALSDAGVTSQQVIHLRAEYDLDDGTPEYEIKFRADGWEYDYEIHAETGEVLSSDKDRDD